jgi:aminoglycoside phosphotransferase (APT) family kinase protein
VQQFSGGASNLTYLLRYPAQDLILRRPPAGTKAKGAHDMGREYRIQPPSRRSSRTSPPMVALCDDESVIGSEFYVMERVAGHIPRKELGLDLHGGAGPPAVHQCPRPARRPALGRPGAGRPRPLGKGEGYVARQVGGWIARFRKAKTWNVPSWEKVIAWLDEPTSRPTGATCLIHNDFRFDNIVLDEADPTSRSRLLDWEMATVGDPLMDLGGTLAYWIEADDDGSSSSCSGCSRPTCPGCSAAARSSTTTASAPGFELTDKEWAFYEVFGLFRLAVILQQIYYRYHHKQTTNPRFKNFWLASHVLHRARRQIIRSRMSVLLLVRHGQASFGKRTTTRSPRRRARAARVLGRRAGRARRRTRL